MLSAETIVELDKEFFYDEQIIWIDRTTRIEEIFNQINEELGNIVAASLSATSSDNKLLFQYEGKTHSLPLTRMPHDRFMVINSIAELTKGEFSFWLAKEFIGQDRQGLFITDKETTEELVRNHQHWIDQYLVKMDLGYDYFTQERVPYLNHLTHLSKIFNRKKLMERLAKERAQKAQENQAKNRKPKVAKPRYMGSIQPKGVAKPKPKLVAQQLEASKIRNQKPSHPKQGSPLSESGLHPSTPQNENSRLLPLIGMLLTSAALLGLLSAQI